MDPKYKGLIWTNHALTRMQERGIKQSDAYVTWSRPDQSRYAKSKGAWIYYRTLSGIKYEVVAKQNEKRKWMILSVWTKSSNQDQSKKVKRKKEGLMQKLFSLIR